MKGRLAQSRTSLLAIILLGIMAVFVLRLFQLQVLQHGKYVELAARNQQRTLVIPATRGEIYMMDGKTPAPVVLNRMIFNVVADPQTVSDGQRHEIIQALRQTAGDKLMENAEGRLANKKSRYEVLARGLTLDQAEQMKKKDFSGVLYQLNSVRNYPEGALGAQVLGFVNANGEGQYGVEGALDKRLKGSDGLLRAVTDVRNVPLMIGKNDVNIEAKAGEDLVLSIDRNVQSYAEEALKRGLQKAGGTEGSVVVMNPNNGRVLAMANYPTFNPAEYNKVQNAAAFINAATMTPQEPGSIMKSFTMAMGIDKGVITPNTTYQNTDCTQVGDRKICNAVRGLTGTTTMQQALNNSHNVGTVTVGRKLGDGSYINNAARQTIYQYFHDKYGFGEKTGIELALVRLNKREMKFGTQT